MGGDKPGPVNQPLHYPDKLRGVERCFRTRKLVAKRFTTQTSWVGSSVKPYRFKQIKDYGDAIDEFGS